MFVVLIKQLTKLFHVIGIFLEDYSKLGETATALHLSSLNLTSSIWSIISHVQTEKKFGQDNEFEKEKSSEDGYRKA